MNDSTSDKLNEDTNPDNHRDFWANLISEYIDGNLAAKPTARLEQHLAACAECQNDLAGMRQTVFGLRRLPDLAAPRSFVLTTAQARRLKLHPFYRFTQIAAAVAAVFLLFTLALDLAGVNSLEVSAPPVAIAPSAQPTTTLEAIGTLAAGPNATRSAIEGFGGLQNFTPLPDPTSVPLSSNPASFSNNTLSGLRQLEVGLALAILIFASFAFALRPRAPGRLKL